MTTDQGLEIRFGSDLTNFLSILMRGRAFRQSKDYWDGNWLLVTVTIQAGKFSGEIPGMIRAEELLVLSERLQTLDQSLSGEVDFRTMEGWLEFRVVADGLGRVRLFGTLQDDVGSQNKLTFIIATDQTFLTATLEQLQQVTQSYPVIGKP